MLTNLQNKVHLKKCLGYCLAILFLFVFLFASVQWHTYRVYTQNYNHVLGALIQYMQENAPETDITELVKILNREDYNESEISDTLLEYGIDIEQDSLILVNDVHWKYNIFVTIILLMMLSVFLTGIFLFYNSKKDKEIAEITYYMEQINRGNYKLELENVSEDELSILKSEVYKTTVMLKEVAENALDGKRALKDSLSDISHQLKTPLASILIMLENLEEHPEMEADTQQFYVRKMKREIQNIHFLVQSLLKLSKLEADVVTFSKEKVRVDDLVEAAVQNVAMLCDLKNVEIRVTGEAAIIYCDVSWQIEAITNVLKNCVEYSPENARVCIGIQDNPVYTAISIRDFGAGMDEEDQKHIFERFYKGKNSVKGSIGIGLSLAKAIIEANDGKINVESNGNGTKFEIKYLK